MGFSKGCAKPTKILHIYLVDEELGAIASLLLVSELNQLKLLWLKSPPLLAALQLDHPSYFCTRL